MIQQKPFYFPMKALFTIIEKLKSIYLIKFEVQFYPQVQTMNGDNGYSPVMRTLLCFMAQVILTSGKTTSECNDLNTDLENQIITNLVITNNTIEKVKKELEEIPR